LNFRGVAYAGKGDFSRAIADFNDAIRLDPRDAVALQNRAAAKQRIGDRAGSDADVEAAKAISPDGAKGHAGYGARRPWRPIPMPASAGTARTVACWLPDGVSVLDVMDGARSRRRIALG